MGRRKRRSALLCNVCQEPRGSSIFPNPSCKSHVVTSRHFTCDSCLYKHVFTTISQDITNRVICPEQGCDAKITRDTIKTILCTFRRQDLWEDYRLKSSWRGTSKEWIKKFTARCPQCRVPIEKNGGCDQVVCRQCHFGFNWKLAKTLNLHQIQPLLKTSLSLGNKMNSFGGNAFGGGFPQQFPGSFPQQGFGQFGSGGGGFNSGIPFQGGSGFPGGASFPPPPPAGFPSAPMGGQFGQGFGFPSAPGGFGYQQPPFAPQFPVGQQPPFGSQFPLGQQPPFGSQFPVGQQPPFGSPNYFGSGSYGRPRSRRSSRRGSKSRRHRSSSSSSSSDRNQNRGPPFAGPGNLYGNLQPFPSMPPLSPRGGSPIIPPRRPNW